MFDNWPEQWLFGFDAAEVVLAVMLSLAAA